MLIAAILGGITYMLYGVVTTLAGFTVVTAHGQLLRHGLLPDLRQRADGQLVPHRRRAWRWAGPPWARTCCSATFVLLLTAFVGMDRYLNGSFYLMGGTAHRRRHLLLHRHAGHPRGAGLRPRQRLPSPGRSWRPPGARWRLIKSALERQDSAAATSRSGSSAWASASSSSATVACISRLIPRLIMTGWEPPKAIASMTVAAILGLIGSYLTGWLDQKIGTKKASIVYGVWYLVDSDQPAPFPVTMSTSSILPCL